MAQNINEEAIAYIQELRRKRNLSVAELSELADINDATLSRLLSGKTSAPSFEHIAKLVTVLGGSLDVIVGLRDSIEAPLPTVERLSAAYNDAKHQYEERLADKKERIETLANDLKTTRKEKYWGYGVLGSLIVAMIVFIVVDAAAGHVGWIRY